MRRFVQPVADSSIYEEFPTRQTGLDEILEIGKTRDGRRVARSLIKFDTSQILDKIPEDVDLSSVRFDLVLSNAYTTKLRRNQKLLAHPITTEWSEGSGYYYQDIVESLDGATWISSVGADQWNEEGGDYEESISGSAVAKSPIPDWTIDVTDIITEWTSGSIENNGILLKFPDDDEVTFSETEKLNEGNIRVFSRNTHTIHSPQLVIKWEDSINTGSLEDPDFDQLMITPRNLKRTYHRGEVATIRLSARNRYPTKTFATKFSQFDGIMALPEDSYFSIIDVAANKIIIPFDEYSKISTDDTGSWFTFSTEAMHVLRHYKIVFKIRPPNGNIITVDDNHRFRVSR